MSMTELTDKELVEKLKTGCVNAFEEIISRYEEKGFNLAMRYTRNQEDAEEVMQDVFTTIYNKIHSFQGKSAFSSWLYRIIVNASFMKLRKNRQEKAISMEDINPIAAQKALDDTKIYEVNTDSLAVKHELQEVIQEAITKLPEQYRAVFVLRDIDGLSNQQVSEILGLSIPAVKSRLHRSRLMLRKKLQHYYDVFTGKQEDYAYAQHADIA